jgi:hypothetical protein
MILNSPYITGSLTVTGNATIAGNITVTGSLSGTATSASYAYTASSAINATSASKAISSSYADTASFANNFTVIGNLTVFGTQSVQYITSSQLNISDNVITVNVASPGVRFGGLSVFDSGSLSSEATASLFWDSQNNHWIYQRESGSTYDGGMIMSGPRNSAGLGNESGTTSCMLLVGQGGDHLTSSMIYHSSTATCLPGTLISTGQICAPTVIASTCLAARAGNATIVANNIAGATSNSHFAMQRNDTQYASIGLNGSDNFTIFGINTSCPRLTIDSSGVASFARQICTTFISANAIDVSNGGASNPTSACVGYGMFGYSGVGLAISSGASGGNQGVGFFLCGIERGRWISSGNLGIGTLCPSFPLDVNGTIRSTGTLIGNNGSISTSTICTIASTTLCSSRGIVIDANTTTNNAFVPIGFSWASSISSYDPTWGMAFKAINYNAGTADLAFYTAGSVKMTVTNGGAVGIANTNPTYRLDVSGTVRIADGGRLYINQLLPLGIVFRNDEFPDGDGNNTRVSDAQATNGDAKRRLSSAPSTTFFYGPYTTIPAGTYIAYFRLKVTNNSSGSTILYMDITNAVVPGGGIYISPSSFTASNRYQYFKIPFIVTDPTAVMEFRGLSFVSGITDLFLDHVMILPGS